MSGGRGTRIRKPVINPDFVMTPISQKVTPACTTHTLTLELDEAIADDAFDTCVVDSFNANDHQLLAEAMGSLVKQHRNDAANVIPGRIGKQRRPRSKCNTLPDDVPLQSLAMRAAFLENEGVSQTRGAWSEYEDILLCNTVEEIGSTNWKTIENHVPGRTSKQCRERWHNHLDPNLSKEEWSNTEDLQMHMGVYMFGHKWSLIAQGIPGRTDNAVKNRYNAYVNAQFLILEAEHKLPSRAGFQRRVVCRFLYWVS